MEGPERRGDHRKKVLKQAKLLLVLPNGTVDVIVRDLYETGAKIEIEAEMVLPPQFPVIMVTDQTMQTAALIWRRGKLAGVHFVGEKSSVKLRKWN